MVIGVYSTSFRHLFQPDPHKWNGQLVSAQSSVHNNQAVVAPVLAEQIRLASSTMADAEVGSKHDKVRKPKNCRHSIAHTLCSTHSTQGLHQTRLANPDWHPMRSWRRRPPSSPTPKMTRSTSRWCATATRSAGASMRVKGSVGRPPRVLFADCTLLPATAAIPHPSLSPQPTYAACDTAPQVPHLVDELVHPRHR